MDMIDDDDDNLFDFVGQFKELQKERKIKALSTINSTINQSLDNNQQLSKNEITTIFLDDTKADTSHISDSTLQSSASMSKTRLQKRNKKRTCENTFINGPVICIGDFDDSYNMPPPKLPVPETVNTEYDYSKFIEQSNITNELLEEEAALTALNHIRNIKVYWRKMKTYRFPLRMFQSIESIYEYFAKLEDITVEFVSLELNNKLLLPSDTPHSINYKITDFIAGDIVFYRSPYDQPKITETEDKDKTAIDEEFKFRINQQDVKYPLFMTLKKTEKMQVLYFKLSEKLGLDINSFILEFDGDTIKITDSIESLNLEGDECFDLYKKSKC